MPYRIVRRMYRRMSLIELVSVGACYWWSLSMAADPHQFRANRGFYLMAHIAPQEVWSVVALVAATTLTAAIIIPLSEPYQRAAALVQVAWWSMLSASIAYASLFSPGVGVYAGMAILQCAWMRKDRHVTPR